MANLSRLKKFRAFIDQIPARAIDMDDVVSRAPQKKATLGKCGAIACGIGWCAIAPELKSFGLRVKKVDKIGLKSWIDDTREFGDKPLTEAQIMAHSYDTSTLLFKGKEIDAYEYASIGAEIFGVDEHVADALFSPKGQSNFDNRFSESTVTKMGHKAILLSRLDHLIENHNDYDKLWSMM